MRGFAQKGVRAKLDGRVISSEGCIIAILQYCNIGRGGSEGYWIDDAKTGEGLMT